MSLEVTAMIERYLEGGDHSGFGRRNPFDKFSGGGGAAGLAKALAAHVTVEDCPDQDTRYSAMLFGQLVGSSALEPPDRTMVKIFMEIAYEDNVTAFNRGLVVAKESVRAAEPKAGTHGGSIPSKQEAATIEATKGMRWQEVVVVSSVLFSGTVPTLAEIEAEGYGSDPGQWQSAKESRKNGKPNLNSFLKSRDAVGYRAMVSRGATRMAANGDYSTGAAQLMLFVNKLSKMTFDQGMPGLFLNYVEEHIEMHKGQGLASATNPLDTNVLTETVLAEKNKAMAHDDKLERVIEQVESLGTSIDQKMKSKMGEVSSMASKLAGLERQMGDRTGPGRGPPSKDNPCQYCGAPDHFIRDCPKKKEADAKKKEAAAAAAADSEA